MKFDIPQPMKIEHEALHVVLRKATKEPGELGAAAITLAKLMHPHFVKEEEYALPPLGLLKPLSEGKFAPEMAEVLAMTDKLKAELPQMLAEHKAIVAALENLSSVAERAGKMEYVAFSKSLMLHAQMEEEVAYTTAILIGEYVKEKLGKKP